MTHSRMKGGYGPPRGPKQQYGNPRSVGMNHIFHSDFERGALRGVRVYVHPMMLALTWVFKTLEEAGAMIIKLEDLTSTSLQYSKWFEETYILVPIPRIPDFSPVSLSNLPQTSSWLIPATPTFLDTRLMVSDLRPSHHPLFRPIPFSLPVPNFPYRCISVLGEGSALLTGYRYFCEALTRGPEVYQHDIKFHHRDKHPLEHVDLVVIAPGEKGELLDFGNDKFWHLPPGRNAKSTPFQDLKALAERSWPPLFVKVGWLDRILGANSESTPIEPYLIQHAEIRDAIQHFRSGSRRSSHSDSIRSSSSRPVPTLDTLHGVSHGHAIPTPPPSSAPLRSTTREISPIPSRRPRSPSLRPDPYPDHIFAQYVDYCRPHRSHEDADAAEHHQPKKRRRDGTEEWVERKLQAPGVERERRTPREERMYSSPRVERERRSSGDRRECTAPRVERAPARHVVKREHEGAEWSRTEVILESGFNVKEVLRRVKEKFIHVDDRMRISTAAEPSHMSTPPEYRHCSVLIVDSCMDDDAIQVMKFLMKTFVGLRELRVIDAGGSLKCWSRRDLVP